MTYNCGLNFWHPCAYWTNPWTKEDAEGVGSYKNYSVMMFFSLDIGLVWQIVLSSWSWAVCMLVLLLSNVDCMVLADVITVVSRVTQPPDFLQGNFLNCAHNHRSSILFNVFVMHVAISLWIKEIMQIQTLPHRVIMMMSTKLGRSHNQWMVLDVMSSQTGTTPIQMNLQTDDLICVCS